MEIGHRLFTCRHRHHNLIKLPFKLPKSPRSILGCRGMASSIKVEVKVKVKVKDRIEVNEKEKQIFERLLGVVRHFSQTDPLFKDTQLRVAGGWVRDKLLGKECSDIDIALDNMLGREFCEKVNEYLSDIGEEKQGIGVIQCNPDQSKHLETARMRLYDVWIDFVNLRSEDYSENSRIPTMKFGTAKEDAYRRDLTINSLFYNINTDSVEDFTQRGLADLKNGQIVTPLSSKATFLDDPLRVLRAIRFGARFGFALDVELTSAAASDEVKAAIADKISRERIGHEVDLMISGNKPVEAMTYMHNLQLFWVVFSLPHQLEQSEFEGCDRFTSHCVACIKAAWRLLHVVGFKTFSDDERRLYLYGSLFLPLRKSLCADNKAKKVPVVNHIFRNSLKLKASDAETVIKLHDAAEKFLPLICSITSNELEHLEEVDVRNSFDVSDISRHRIVIGKLLREIKSFWRVALLISNLITLNDLGQMDADELNKRKRLFERVEVTIMELGLDKVWEMKPLINGKEIMKILDLKTGGPQVRIWQERLLEWQLGHPTGTAKECLDWMRQELESQTQSQTKLEEIPIAAEPETDV